MINKAMIISIIIICNLKIQEFLMLLLHRLKFSQVFFSVTLYHCRTVNNKMDVALSYI